MLQRTLLSRPNLEKLVSNTDLDLNVTGPSDLERLVGQLAGDIKIVPQTRNLFTITYRNNNPKLAFDVVQTILTTFIESKTGNNRSEMENAGLFLNQQIAGYERQLRDAEKKRADFRAKYVDLLPAGDSGANRLDGQEGVLRQLQGQLTDELARRDTLNKELSATPASVVTETEAIAAAGGGSGPGGVVHDPQVDALQRDLDDLLLRDTDNHPDVVAAKARLAAAKVQAAARAAEFAQARAKAVAAAGAAGAPRADQPQQPFGAEPGL